MTTLDLTVDIQNRKFYVNNTTAATVEAFVFTRLDTVQFRVQPVKRNLIGGLRSQMEIVDVTPLTLQMAVGALETPYAVQITWTKDEANDWFTGALSFNSTPLEDPATGLFQADPSPPAIEALFEVRFLEAGQPISVIVPCTLRNAVIVTGAPAPTDIDPPSALAANLATLLVDSDDIDVQQSGNTFLFVLKDAGRPSYWTAADQAAMLALAARKGDWARRSDTNRFWLLTTADPTQLANWQEAPAGFDWQGAWSAIITYVVDAGVSKNGSSYISLQAGNLNHDPADVATIGVWWDVLAAGSTIQLATATELPSEITEQAASNQGAGAKAARSDHVHKALVATQTVAGLHSAADKRRFDMSLGPYIGGFNGIVEGMLVDGDRIVVTGAFTKYGNTPAPGIMIMDRHGLPMPDFNPGTGFTGNAPWFIIKCSDGDYMMARSTKIPWQGGTVQWLHKIDVTGTADPAFTSPATIAATGGDTLMSMAPLVDKVALLTWQTLRIIDLTGVTTATANSASDMHGLAKQPGADKVVVGQDGGDLGGVTLPHALKLVSSAAVIDATWAAGAGDGGNANVGQVILWSPNGDYVIASNGGVYGATGYEWDGGAANKHKGLYKINADGTEAADWTATIVVSASGNGALPMFIDSQGRIYFAGDVTSVNGTAVTANRLYRIDADGSNLKVFAAFNGTVYRMSGVDDEHLIVVGAFTAYGTAPVGRMVFIDADGNLIPTLDEDVDVTGAQSVSITGAGTTQLEITGGGVQSLVATVTDTYGGGAFTHNLILPDFGATEGDRLFARFILPASIDPAINVLSPTAAGSTLLAFNSLSLVSELTARFVFRNGAWELEDFSWHTSDGAPVQNLYTRGTVDYAAAVAIDLDGPSVQEITATGALELSTLAGSRAGAGRAKDVSLIITASGGDRAISFATGIKGVGNTLLNGKTAAIALRSRGANETDTIAAYAQLD